MRFRVEYTNETSGDDNFFREWWQIIDTTHYKLVVAECESENWAKVICQMLNTIAEIPA